MLTLAQFGMLWWMATCATASIPCCLRVQYTFHVHHCHHAWPPPQGLWLTSETPWPSQAKACLCQKHTRLMLALAWQRNSGYESVGREKNCCLLHTGSIPQAAARLCLLYSQAMEPIQLTTIALSLLLVFRCVHSGAPVWNGVHCMHRARV